MFIFFKPTKDQLLRIEAHDSDHPRWFGSPIKAAFGTPTFSHSALKAIGASMKGENNFLVFTVSSQEVLASLRLRRKNLITLFQWPLTSSKRELPKQFARDLVLSSSKTILVYSKKSQVDVQQRFPHVPVRWIGHFVDTEFFSPQKVGPSNDPFLLCVGDHLRLEPIVVEIARRLRIRVVRVSTSPEVKKYYSENKTPFVELECDVSFTRLRFLYATCSVVLNAVDDRLWPVGITSFCEALSMGRPIVSSGYHSCSGYVEHLSTDCARTVSDLSAPYAWQHEIEGLLGFGNVTRAASTGLAKSVCSMERMSAEWRAVGSCATASGRR